MRFSGFQTARHRSPYHLSRTSCLEVSLQGISMHGEGDSLYGITSIEGWAGGVSSRGGVEAYDDADGGFPTDVYYSGRDIVVEGEILAPDHHGLVAAREELETVLTSPREDWLRVREEHLGMDRQILVHRPRPVQVSLLGDRDGIFTLTLHSAGFPRLAVEESELILSPGGSGRQENVGDYPADMSLFLEGPLTNPRITWSNQFWWQFNGTIPSGQVRSVDMSRRMIRNPAAGTRLDLSGTGTWPKVDPGYRTVRLSGSGSGSARLVWRSSWA